MAIGDLSGFRHLAALMQNLLTTLLARARRQSGHRPIKLGRVDASTALLCAWAGFQPAALDKRLDITVQTQVGAHVRADPDVLEMVLSNLLDNATSYAPIAGQIELSAMPDGDHVAIAIGSTTDTITADDLPHLFEPFWRKGTDRTGGSHSGLGLSLVAAVVSMMGGEIQALLNQPGWIRFVVTLPSA